MRRARFLLPVLGLGLPVLALAARPPYVVEERPPDVATLRRQVTQEIPAYLEASQCGGWDLSQSVAGKIATVEGVPGRSGDWDGAILSGMAVRSDDYHFPAQETTQGFVTACDSDTSFVTKLVWDEDRHRRVPRDFPHPYFTDPICRWRLIAGDPPIPLPPDTVFAPAEFTEQEVQVDPVTGERTPGNRLPLSPPACADMCEYLNRWQYKDCLQTVEMLDESGNVILDQFGVPLRTCPDANWGMRYLCTDVPVDAGGSCAPGDRNGGPNARACTGAECRCPTGDMADCLFSPMGEEDGSSPVGRWYLSYFRQYVGRFFRDLVPQAADDQEAEENIGVACYGFYDEFDPKVERTGWRDRRCVINIDVSDRRTTQRGKGVYGQTSALPDITPAARNPSFDAEEDLWYPNLGGGFSLLSEKVFQEEYGRDLAAVYREGLDAARVSALPQLTAQRPLAQSNAIRAFDDTAQERTIASWWQKQQQEVSVLLHRPVIRLILPAAWLFGADALDPLLSAAARPVAGPPDLRGERIEVQIAAEEDLLGAALRGVERSLLFSVREEPVPVVVPLGSPTEFRAVAEAWCLWWMRQRNQPHCEDAPEEVRQLRATLLDYADRIEDVRMVRGELARYAGNLLALQAAVTQPLRDWVREHLDAYRAVLDEQRAIADAVTERWETARHVMERYQSVTNRPWCMNQRFTLPVYSLLDEWMPTRAQGGGVHNAVAGEGGVPLPTLSIPRPEDVIVDLSDLKLGTGTLALPVLRPVQIRMTHLPRPPTVDTLSHGLTDPLPQLPPLDPVLDAVRRAADGLPDAPAASAPPPPDLPIVLGPRITMLLSTLDWIGWTVTGMDERTRLFWESIGPFTPQEREAQAGDPQSHLARKNRLECAEWDDPLCQHVEMDLVERLTRIAARPDVQLREDSLSVGAPQVFPTCPPENRACQPLHPEGDTPRIRWELGSPDQGSSVVERMRSAVRDATLPAPVGTQDPALLPRYDIEPDELLPPYDVPPPIDLRPPPSAPPRP